MPQTFRTEDLGQARLYAVDVETLCRLAHGVLPNEVLNVIKFMRFRLAVLQVLLERQYEATSIDIGFAKGNALLGFVDYGLVCDFDDEQKTTLLSVNIGCKCCGPGRQFDPDNKFNGPQTLWDDMTLKLEIEAFVWLWIKRSIMIFGVCGLAYLAIQ